MQRIDKKDVVLHDKYWIQNRVESGRRIIEYFESIPCGGFREINDNTEGYLEIPSSLLGNGEYFAVRAHGSSMIDAGIEDTALSAIIANGTFGDIPFFCCLGNGTILHRINLHGYIICPYRQFINNVSVVIFDEILPIWE